MRHSATVSKAGLCIALQCHPSVWQSATVSRAGLCIAYCKVECFQNQVSIAVQRYPKQDHLCLHCKLRRRLNRRVYNVYCGRLQRYSRQDLYWVLQFANCNPGEDVHCGTVQRYPMQDCVLRTLQCKAECNGIQGRNVFCALQCYPSVQHSALQCNGIQGRIAFLRFANCNTNLVKMYIVAECNGIQSRIFVFCFVNCNTYLVKMYIVPLRHSATVSNAGLCIAHSTV